MIHYVNQLRGELNAAIHNLRLDGETTPVVVKQGISVSCDIERVYYDTSTGYLTLEISS